MLTQSNQWLAAQEIAAIQMRYAQSGRTLNEAALCGAKDFVEWQHYPTNDLIDEQTGYEFYYHAHTADEMPNGEHGHFHLIKREGERFHHLVGIALDQKGLPVRLFTTNQWVTGESIESCDQVMKSIRRFHMETKGRMAPVSKWVAALLQLFAGEIEHLLADRDLKIKKLAADYDNIEAALNSRRHHVLSECRIDLISQLSHYLLASN